jgi:hypothetical protein
LADGGEPACRVEGCRAPVCAALESERLCVDHFIKLASQQLSQALEDCRSGIRIQWTTFHRLSHQAELAVIFLETHNREDFSPQRNHLLELILGVANLHEYLSLNASLFGATR